MQITHINNKIQTKGIVYSKSLSYTASVPLCNSSNNAVNTDTVQNDSFFDMPYYQPLSFGKIKRQFSSENRKLAEKSGDFVVSRFSDIPCPACGKKMLNQHKFEQISQELAKLEPEEYLDYLSQYIEYMRPVEESVFNEIYALSKKPEQSSDIRELLVQLRETKMPVLQKAQMGLINKMQSLARTLPPEEKAVLQGKVNSLKRLIHKNNTNSPFRRKIMIDRISKVKIRNPRKYEKLQVIAKNFPTSRDMNSAWIVKYSGKNKLNQDWASYDIALRFLSSSVANTDHIVAYDIENNHDDITNYVSMHNACNSLKGNKPFLQWLYEDKDNRINYLRNYFSSVDNLISNKRITKKKYKNYVAHATQTIYEASKGQVKLFDEKKEIVDDIEDVSDTMQ